MSLRELAATSEQMGRNVLLGLHSLGDNRDAEQEDVYQELVERFYDPGLTIADHPAYRGPVTGIRPRRTAVVPVRLHRSRSQARGRGGRGGRRTRRTVRTSLAAPPVENRNLTHHNI